MKTTGWRALFAVRVGRKLCKVRRRASSRLFAGGNAPQAEILEVRSLLSTVTAVNDSVAVAHNGMVTGNVLSNDTIPNSGRLVGMNYLPDPTLSFSYAGTKGSLFSLDTNPTSGSFGTFSYMPNFDVINDTDTFTYTITDPATSDSSMGTVTITISDHSTIATQDDSMPIDIGQTDPVTIQVVTNADIDSDGDELFIDSSSLPTGVAASADGKSVIYTPPSGGLTTDGCEFQVDLTDNHGNAAAQNVKVAAIGGAPGPGVFLTDHPVAFGFRHTAILIVLPLGDPLEADPRYSGTYVVGNTTYHYATISAGPAAVTVGGLTVNRLRSEVNRPGDQPQRNKVIEELNINGSSISSIGMQLLFLDSNFIDDERNYQLHPQGTPELDYNSNGYVHGLLDALGKVENVSYSSNLVDQVHSGWSVPVEDFYFGVD
jgi:Big-like domain-containing protein